MAHGVDDEDWKRLIDGAMHAFLKKYSREPEDKIAVDRIGPQVL